MPWLQLPATALAAGERAIRGHQFVADAWRQADSALQPYVAEALVINIIEGNVVIPIRAAARGHQNRQR